MKNLGKKSKQRKASGEQHEQNQKKQTNDQQSPYYNDDSNTDFTKFQPRIQTTQQQQKNQTTQNPPSRPQIQTSMLQYKIQKLLSQSQKREQSYQQYIKKKHQQSYGLTENYIQTLRKYKEQLDNFIQQRNKKKQSKFQVYQANKVFLNQHKPINKYKKLKLAPSHKQERQGYKVDLQCKITVKFICPFVQDYLKDKFPQNLDIKLQLPIKNKFLHMADKSNPTLQVSIKMQDDEEENIDNLINGYPFSLTPSGNKNGRKFSANQGETLSHEFRILNEAGNIEDLQKGKMQIKVFDRDSKMLWAYSSLSTQRLLYYSEQSTLNTPVETMQTEIIELYSPYSHQNNSIIHIRQFFDIIFQVHKYFNSGTYLNEKLRIQMIPIYSQRSGNRIESTGPLLLAAINVDRNLYGDQQSRQLQRINKFKSTAYSLTMRPDVDVFNKDADKQKMFEKTNDKNLINYRRMKELQTISNYKEKQKNQYVETLFDQALTKFALEQVQMGVPKYLVFYYEKERSQPEKIFLKSQIKVNGLKQVNAQDILKQVETKMMTKQEVEFLIEKGVVKVKSDCYIDVQGSQKEGFYVFDNKVAFVYKMIIYSNSKLTHLVEQNEDDNNISQQPNSNKDSSKLRIEVFMKMHSQVGELLSQQVYNVQPIQAACNIEMSFHNYESAQEQVDIPLGLNNSQPNTREYNQSDMNNNIKVIGSENLVYKINRQTNTLEVKVKYHKLSQNIFYKNNTNKRCLYITLLDSRNNLCLNKYKLTLYSYHKMDAIENYEIGEIAKYKFEFNVDRQVNKLLLETTSYSKVKKGDTIRVGLFTSHPNQTDILCNGKQQLIINSNQTYQIEVAYQSFSMNSEDRVICHVLDLDSNVIVKKWLLKIQKNPAQFKAVNHVKVSFNKQIKYPYFLKNKSSKQTSFKLFTSNFSLLTVPESLIQLSPNQQVNVDLKFIVRKQNFSVEQKQKGISVILRIQDILTKEGWNQLFKILLE